MGEGKGRERVTRRGGGWDAGWSDARKTRRRREKGRGERGDDKFMWDPHGTLFFRVRRKPS